MTRPLGVVAGVAFDSEGRVLMTQRPAAGGDPNKWEWPGGKVKAGETHAAALRREWREELGVDVQVIRRIGSVDLDRAVTLNLYLVQLPRTAQPTARAAQALRWVAPVEAGETYDCAPGVARLYKAVAGLARRASGRAAGRP